MPKKKKHVLHRLLLLYIVAGWLLIGLAIVKIIREEVQTSKYQARYLSEISQQLSYKLVTGASDSIRYPHYGPYDQKLGYTSLPSAIERLQKAGFTIAEQAAISPMMTELFDYGLFNIYHEKNQAGLRIIDHNNRVLFNRLYPSNGYPDFESIPPVILNTLLYIENRELLKYSHTTINPAIEWDRLGFAALQVMASKIGITGNPAGGSTLATQIEKYRHSPNGYTNSLIDKLRQMSTASLRAYLMGKDTRQMRQEIALAYLNSMPLAATPKSGEVHGLGDGLADWFGADFKKINQLLDPQYLTGAITSEQAHAYRQVLNILLSQRRPSYFLGRGFKALQNLTDSYLRLMAEQGIITAALRDATLQVANERPPNIDTIPRVFATEKKTQAILRTRLAQLTGVKSNYELDRLDLTVKTSLDYKTQSGVSKVLHGLNQADQASAAGVVGFRMLGGGGQALPITYSLMLFEKSDVGNLLRVQTDNYDQPLDINEGIRLDLGSTSKLRTLVHYLELVNQVYQQYKNYSHPQLKQLNLHPRDYISEWVVQALRANPKMSLEELLNAAIDKKYSASPAEYFFTGGGIHHFNNFNENDDNKIISVRTALRDSVNLVFIRLMREIVYHHLYKPEGIARWLESPDDPRRREYLERFADREGKSYLQRFYKKYQGKSEEQIVSLLTQKVLAKPSRLTMLYQAIYPNRDVIALNEYLSKHISRAALIDENIEQLYEKYSPKKFDLQDQGYITKVHPLELWLVGYLINHPNASQDEIMQASGQQRLAVYRWLFSSHRKNAQQKRIMSLLEAEAFKEIHQAWQRVGYPFDSLTPSYATSIGASGDRPAALADLMGVLQNDGRRMPTVRFESLHYAQGTPYETLMQKAADKGEQIFPHEVAKVAKEALMGVVNGGTAARVQGVYADAHGQLLAIGGKTGTGDHRKEVWASGGRLIESKFISRAATFTFFIGERFFGVITAYIEGDEAENYHFTSALPVQILKYLKPTLSPLLTGVDKPTEPIIATVPPVPVIENKAVKPTTPPPTVVTAKPKPAPKAVVTPVKTLAPVVAAVAATAIVANKARKAVVKPAEISTEIKTVPLKPAVIKPSTLKPITPKPVVKTPEHKEIKTNPPPTSNTKAIINTKPPVEKAKTTTAIP
ncbi:MAG: transglycosylase domain-containing protein [Methylococcaceae bacterium]